MKRLKEFEGFSDSLDLRKIFGGEFEPLATCVDTGCTETGLAHDNCSDECSD